MRLGALDLGTVAFYLLATVVLGAWIGRRARSGDGARSSQDFLLGSRALPWWLLLFSIVATETSTVTFLTIPGIAYGGDLTWLQLPIGFALGRLLVVTLLLPGYFRGELFTAYELLATRFGSATKQVASVMFLAARTGADGLRLYLTAIALQEVTGIGLPYAVTAIGIATIVYTGLGGIRAVVWTDFLQFLVYIGGAAAALWILCDRIPGGWTAVLDQAEAAGKLRLIDTEWTLDRATTLWAGLLGGALLSFGTHGVDQMMVQRYLSARSPRQAGLAVALSGPVVWLQFAFFMALGLALWSFDQSRGGGAALAGDRVFARFALEELPPGLVGVVLGAVFAAAMSTLSSSLHACATSATCDLHLPRTRGVADDTRRLRLARRYTILFGLAQVGIALAGQGMEKSVIDGVLAIAGFTTGIVLGVFLLGRSARVGQNAALAGLLLGLVTVTAVAFGTSVAWPWFALVGAGTTWLGGKIAAKMLP